LKLLLKSFIYVIAILFLWGCTQTWKFQEDDFNTKQKTLDKDVVVIERMEGRWSPRIKVFKHMDLNIYKKQGGRQNEKLDLVSPGSLHEHDWQTPTHVETPPGKIKLGVILNWGGNVTYSYVKFNALSGHKYLLTWVCIPYPFIAVVDEKTSKIVAIDLGCSNCDWLIGTKISKDTECLYERTIPRPSWGKVDREKFIWEYNPPFDKEKMRLFSNSPYDKDRRLKVHP